MWSGKAPNLKIKLVKFNCCIQQTVSSFQVPGDKPITSENPRDVASTHDRDSHAHVCYLSCDLYCTCTYLWQSQVEIKHYSVAYFDHVTTFEAL